MLNALVRTPNRRIALIALIVVALDQLTKQLILRVLRFLFAEVEQRHILHTVRNCRTQDEAARMLGVSTKTLYNKLRLYESWRRNGNPAGGAPLRETRRSPATEQPAGDTTWN